MARSEEIGPMVTASDPVVSNPSMHGAFGGRRWIFAPLLIFSVWRVLTLLLGWQSLQIMPQETPDWIYNSDAGQVYDAAIPGDAVLYDWVEPWHRWDSGWYLMNAMRPFTFDSAAAFAPLFSLITGAVAPAVSSDFVLAGLIVSNAACAAAFVLLYRLVQVDFGGGYLPIRTVATLAAFPTAFFLTAVYAEALYLLLVLLMFFAVNHRQWWLAGLAAGLATLARMQGLLLVIPLGWMVLMWVREQSAGASGRWAWVRPSLRALPAVSGPIVAWVVFSLVVSWHGLASFSEAAARGWQSSFQAPWMSMLTFFERVLAGQATIHEFEGAAALLFAALTGITVLRRFKPAYTLYVGASVFTFMAVYFEGPQFQSNARHVIVLFPCFAALALWLKTPRRTWVFVILSAVAQAWLILRFTHWGWVA